MNAYKSVARREIMEVVIKKSRFIAQVFPVENEEEAKARLEKAKKAHSDATHNVFAYQVGVEGEMQKCSDDGEPGGTAGKPVLEAIKQNELTNVLIVVTRYFGGVKLGAGGLIRAYGRAAREVINKARVISKQVHTIFEVIIDYSFLGPVQREAEKWGLIDNIEYSENVCLTVLIPETDSDNFENAVRGCTNDNAKIEKQGKKFA